jgi:hypothetical protein
LQQNPDGKHDLFRAIQRLSLFIMNKGGAMLDETSRNIVRGVFNENATRMIEHYERRVEELRL